MNPEWGEGKFGSMVWSGLVAMHRRGRGPSKSWLAQSTLNSTPIFLLVVAQESLISTVICFRLFQQFVMRFSEAKQKLIFQFFPSVSEAKWKKFFFHFVHPAHPKGTKWRALAEWQLSTVLDAFFYHANTRIWWARGNLNINQDFFQQPLSMRVNG